jgi:hypothetical protein
MGRLRFLRPFAASRTRIIDVTDAEELRKRGYTKTNLKRGFSEIRKLFDLAKKHNGTICGGYARWCVTSNPDTLKPTDIDIFFEDKQSFIAMSEELEKTLQYADGVSYVHKHVSRFAITYKPYNPTMKSLGSLATGGITQIQLIDPAISDTLVTGGNVLDILDNFDLDVCQAAILSSEEVLVSHGLMANDDAQKMSVVNVRNPMMTLARVCKYSKAYKLDTKSSEKLLTHYMEESKKDAKKADSTLQDHKVEYAMRGGNS